jgi:hypothetical protein
MSKLVLELQIRSLDIRISSLIRVHDEKSWFAVRNAIRTKALGCFSRSAYLLVGFYRPNWELVASDPTPSWRVVCRRLASSQVEVCSAVVYGGGFETDVRSFVVPYRDVWTHIRAEQQLIDTVG